MESFAYLYTMSNAQNTATMNNVKNLPRRYSWEYLYEVNGCIFTLEKNEYGFWYLTGYDSKEDLEQGDFFISENMGLKRNAKHFLKFDFERSLWAAS